MKTHPTAIVSKGAKIADDVEIGPYSIVDDGVTIGSGSVIQEHACVRRGTTIGKDCKIHMGAVLGDEPQDIAYKGEESYLTIGDRNTFREYVTVHRGTQRGSATTIGNDNYFMALSHIAHNCKIGNDVTICNNSLFGGHVVVDDKAFISGSGMIHQFVRIGTLAFVAGGVKLTKDLPPFMLADSINSVATYNIVGIKRAGFDSKARKEIKEAFRIIYRSGLNLSNALAEIEKREITPEVKCIVDFIRTSKRGICFSRSNRIEDDIA